MIIISSFIKIEVSFSKIRTIGERDVAELKSIFYNFQILSYHRKMTKFVEKMFSKAK